MTRNQIEYWKNQETIKHNREIERLTGESNTEIKRANRAREGLTAQSNAIARSQLQETERSNRARESLNLQTLLETQRSNLERERLTKYSADVQLASAQASAAATKYAADASAAASRYASDINRANTLYSVDQKYNEMYTNLAIARDSQSETTRHNKAMEVLTEEGQLTGLLGSLTDTVGKGLTALMK